MRIFGYADPPCTVNEPAESYSFLVLYLNILMLDLDADLPSRAAAMGERDAIRPTSDAVVDCKTTPITVKYDKRNACAGLKHNCIGLTA